MRLCRYFLLLLIANIHLVSVSGQAPAQQLTIYAATSLTDAFESLSAAFIENQSDAEILLNFASSSTLAAQISAGAPADIFASANEKQMTLVIDDGRINADDVAIFAHNQLVLILSVTSAADVTAVEDLTDDSILLVLAARGTPIRAYTDAMFASHNSDFGDDFQDRVMRNLVSEESNVRQVVTRVALGEADAGIVYQSDVLGTVSDQLITIPIADQHNQLASYPIAPLSDSANPQLAAQFIDFILTEPAQAILRDAGFCSPVILDEVQPTDPTPEPTPDAVEETAAETNPCTAE